MPVSQCPFPPQNKQLSMLFQPPLPSSPSPAFLTEASCIPFYILKSQNYFPHSFVPILCYHLCPNSKPLPPHFSKPAARSVAKVKSSSFQPTTFSILPTLTIAARIAICFLSVSLASSLVLCTLAMPYQLQPFCFPSSSANSF